MWLKNKDLKEYQQQYMFNTFSGPVSGKMDIDGNEKSIMDEL